MKRLVFVGVVLLLFLLSGCGNAAHGSGSAALPLMPHVSVCTDTGLTGPAQQENLLYCDTNQITSVVTNAAASTYPAAIALAQTKHIIVGTPISVSQTVAWNGVSITYVEFSSGFHAEHFNPSNGAARMYDQYDRQVYP